MRDFVPHTYNRYKDARGRVADLINSQEIFVMAPFTDEDIYGADYEPSQEEIDARTASIAAYEEAVANLGVIGSIEDLENLGVVDSIEALYAIHMVELTGDRLIALPANLSKLQDVYASYGNAVAAGTEGQYTADSLEAYQHAETFTEEILAAGANNVVPSQVNTATTELVYAWKHLETCADYSTLDRAIAQAQPEVDANGTVAEDQNAYTVDSYKAFIEAYNNAINVDRDLGASDNEYLRSLAESLNDAFAALVPAEAEGPSEPTFEISTDEIYFNPTWDVPNAAYLDPDAVANLGSVSNIDGIAVDAFLILGNGIYSEDDVKNAFTNVENVEFVITPNENGMYGTGALVQICDTEYTPYYTYFVVVRGDVNGDGDFNDVDAGEMDLAGNYIYDWFWNSYETYDQYKSTAGDTNGDFAVDSVDSGLLTLAYNYQGYYDMVYGGEM